MKIEFRQYSFEVREYGGIKQIRDLIRKKYVALTPEEWVRQHLLHFFIADLGYPKSRIAVEQGLKLAGTTKRADICIYDQKLKPWMVVECKAPEVNLTQKVLDQATAYNLTLEAPYLTISNGTDVCILNTKTASNPELENWPDYML